MTLCDNCPEDTMEIAKYAVKEITDDFEESNEWALQHVDKVTSKVRIILVCTIKALIRLQ